MVRSRSTTPVADTSATGSVPAASPRAVPRAMRRSPERPHTQAPYSRPDAHRPPQWRDSSPAWTLASVTSAGTRTPDVDAVTISSASSVSGDSWLNVEGGEFPRPSPSVAPLPLASNPLSPPSLPPSNPLSPLMHPLPADMPGPSTRPGLRRRPSTPPLSEYITEAESERGQGKGHGCAGCAQMNDHLATTVDMIANLARMQEAHQARQYWESERLSAMGAVLERLVQSVARIEQCAAAGFPTAAGPVNETADGDAENESLALDIKMETELFEKELHNTKAALPDIKTELPDLPPPSAPPGYPLYLAQLPDPHVLGDSVRELRTGLRTLEEKVNYLCTWTEDNTVHAPLAVISADIEDMKNSLAVANVTKANKYDEYF